ncbi:MFS transporter [Zavarzinia compransoris]|uniref:MFS transporter n=1 Tax=Zavarzinia marina TaxID=2911065 RepID=UPI001F19CA64|nr:MFS transporter [Zavarzinia marina]MCF4164894.1 MFS transporter [Zavarzinia marina]
MKAVVGKDVQGSARWALASLALSMLLASLGVSIANVALPALSTAFSVPLQAVQWVVLGYLLTVTVMIVAAGRLGDALGHGRVLSAGLLLFTAASAFCAVAPSLWLLVAARVAQGLGAAVLMALTVALVREAVPASRTGSAMGLLGTMSAIGTALGPSLGGLLLAGPGWRAIFLVMVPMGAANVFLARRYLPAGGGRVERPGFDGLGTVLLGAALAAYALAMTAGTGRFVTIAALLLAAAIFALLFHRVEMRAAAALIPPAVWRDRRLGASLAANALVATVMMATLVVGPFYLARGLGLGAATVGLVMSVGPVLSAFSGVPSGRLVDRLGATRVIVLGLGLMACGAAGLALLPGMFGVAGYVGAVAILTPGYQLFQAANNTAVMAGAEGGLRGVISGVLSLSRNLGLVSGASAMGAVFALAAGTGEMATAEPDAVAFGMRVTFLIAAGLIALALVPALRIRRGHGG